MCASCRTRCMSFPWVVLSTLKMTKRYVQAWGAVCEMFLQTRSVQLLCIAKPLSSKKTCSLCSLVAYRSTS